MTQDTDHPAPHVLVLFGATGDLAKRKLFPGLYHLAEDGRLPEVRLVGSGRHSPGDDDEFRQQVRDGLAEFVDDLDSDIADDLVSKVSFQVSSAEDGSDLAAKVADLEEELGGADEVKRLIYLSIPPNAMEGMIAMLGKESLTDRARLVIEKPFGLDLESSRELDAALKEVVEEEQVFRIDHFLGKEAVQNILALRFANGLFEPAWNRSSIESVQIDVPEELDAADRGSFYESTGCLRDMISTHLCQILGFIALEDPRAFNEKSVRDAKSTLFADLQPLDPERVVFGQYDGYRDIDDVADDSEVETFVAIEAFVDNERWRGVPFYLRTGKALAATRRTITLRFRRPDSEIFSGDPGANELVLELTDEAKVRVDLRAKKPGPTMDLTEACMELQIGSGDPTNDPLEAYERLLLDVLHGDQTLFTRSDEVDRLWQVCEPVLEHRPEVQPYRPGSWGPQAADELPQGGWHLNEEQPARAERVVTRTGTDEVGDATDVHVDKKGRATGYLPIADHGLIGDLRTCALVGVDATIDWFCAPRFDSPSVFGSLLDAEQGGSWGLEVVDGENTTTNQFYLPETNILVTRFLTDQGVAEVHDFMPLLKAHDPDHRQRIVRRVLAVRGTARLRMDLRPRPDYGRTGAEIEAVDGGLLLRGDGVRMGLTATVDLQVDDGSVTCDLQLDRGQDALFVLEVLDPDDADSRPRPEDCADSTELFEDTARYWRDWLSTSTYTGRWRESVDRSALTLKLMTHEPSGAIIASPTTSLPEEIGGGRNWDYRFVWIRDAAFSLYALLSLGFTSEAAAFMAWLSQRLGGEDLRSEKLGPLRVLYDIDGNVPTSETELDHLSGYRDSRPVRVGNAAVDQLQLDIYGELIDSIYLFNKYGPGISHDSWNDLTRVVDWLADNWDRDDAGMWEIRDRPRHHTTSRLMSWVALERMIRTARQRGLPGDLSRWAEVRDDIYRDIDENCWDDAVGAYMQHAGADTLDAGVLLMPMVKFVAPNDPRFLSTLAAIEDRLVSDSLVFRYDNEAAGDGLDGEEGTFSMCSFWYVEALTRVGRLDDARLALEKMFTYANHLGLYAEEVGLTGDQLGNFPQAFTHLSLISAAINLDRALG